MKVLKKYRTVLKSKGPYGGCVKMKPVRAEWSFAEVPYGMQNKARTVLSGRLEAPPKQMPAIFPAIAILRKWRPKNEPSPLEKGNKTNQISCCPPPCAHMVLFIYYFIYLFIYLFVYLFIISSDTLIRQTKFNVFSTCSHPTFQASPLSSNCGSIDVCIADLWFIFETGLSIYGQTHSTKII